MIDMILDNETLVKYKELKLEEKDQADTPFLRSMRSKLEKIQERILNIHCPEIILGDRRQLSSSDYTELMQCLNALKPWKKGPFRIFGEEIDSEWRSDWKWNRILPHCPSLKDKVIADIGCNNGYYMFRMAAEEPKKVIGFEPVVNHWLCFDFLQSYAQIPSLQFEPFGVEHIDAFPNTFDVIFCLGILYHHKDPIGILEKIRSAMKPSSTLIIDCQGVPHDDSIALVPKGTYAGTYGTWFLPSLSCLLNWVRRSGFKEAVCFYQAPLSELEQRRTAWAPVKSLSDFLSPIDDQKTIEGYPRPWRFYVRAKN